MATTFTLTNGKSRLALSLALLSMLFMSALQVTEASHLHIVDESPGHCLVCQADGHSVAGVQPTPMAPLAGPLYSAAAVLCPALASPFELPPLRGPPSYA